MLKEFYENFVHRRSSVFEQKAQSVKGVTFCSFSKVAPLTALFR